MSTSQSLVSIVCLVMLLDGDIAVEWRHGGVADCSASVMIDALEVEAGILSVDSAVFCVGRFPRCMDMYAAQVLRFHFRTERQLEDDVISRAKTHRTIEFERARWERTLSECSEVESAHLIART